MARLEAELLQAGQELARLHRELEALRERLRRERAEREELLDVVSHELRTPLTVIGGYHRLLLGRDVGPLNEQQRKFLEESHRSCQRLEAFVDKMLEASRAGTRASEVLELGRAPLAPVIEAVAAMFGPLLAERGPAPLASRSTPDAGEARFDPLRIEQVLTNLVGNAVKFTRAGGAIEIATRARVAPENAGCAAGSRSASATTAPASRPSTASASSSPTCSSARAARAAASASASRSAGGIVEAHGGADPRRGAPGRRLPLRVHAARRAAERERQSARGGA